MRQSVVTSVKGMVEEGWFERECCHWCHGDGRIRLVGEGVVSLVSWEWNKKVGMRWRAGTGVMGMKEEAWYEMEHCHWCHGYGRRRLV
ncbi:hypothetical protein DPMN_163564 [Dreissena polymorpha]|uniref:Uncharacterized protein n=1 Tax=Dreissena polymorpha TaxID=45954 RepID=A0A9D4ETH3_DREPO|nr:hypothetical protein DPMN_163564 [Dreissena polymorpha]